MADRDGADGQLPAAPVRVFGNDNDWLLWLAMFLASAEHEMQSAFRAGYRTGSDKVPPEVALREDVQAAQQADALTDSTRAAIRRRAELMGDSVVESFATGVQAVINSALDAGLTLEETREQVRGFVASFAASHSEMLARTESVWAARAGEAEFYRRAGALYLVWLHHPDACAFCLEVSGRVADIEREFFARGDHLTVDGQTLDFDFSDIPHPPLHPNCRCSLEARWT